jgi:hypothetical protein
VTRLPALLEVSENMSRVGISVDPNILQFGILPKNITTQKILYITNGNKVPVKVNLKVYGTISPFVKFNKNNFILSPNQNISVNVKGGGNIVGKYDGEVQVIIKIPKNWWSESLLFLA